MIIYLTINLNLDTTWWKLGSIFREVGVNLIDWESTLAIRLLIRHDSKSCNRYTTASLVINQAQLDWPRQEDFSCKRIETQARKGKHAIWNCRCIWSKDQDGVQALITKGLITTVVKNKNGGPDSQQKNLSSQLQWRRQFLDEKLDLNKTQV